MLAGDPLDSWVFKAFSRDFYIFRIDGLPVDIHEEQSNIWGPKIDRMKISEYKVIARNQPTVKFLFIFYFLVLVGPMIRVGPTTGELIPDLS